MVLKITYITGCNDLTSKDYRHSIITEKQNREIRNHIESLITQNLIIVFVFLAYCY